MADREAAAALVDRIESLGGSCWIAPRDVGPGEVWADCLAAAVANCQRMLLCFSRHAQASEHVLRELTIASGRAKPIVTVRLDHVEPADRFEYQLSISQWVDATRGDRSWDDIAAVIHSLAGAKSASRIEPRTPRDPVRLADPDDWGRGRINLWLRSKTSRRERRSAHDHGG